jgi:hypothetical protein
MGYFNDLEEAGGDLFLSTILRSAWDDLEKMQENKTWFEPDVT